MTKLEVMDKINSKMNFISGAVDTAAMVLLEGTQGLSPKSMGAMLFEVARQTETVKTLLNEYDKAERGE